MMTCNETSRRVASSCAVLVCAAVFALSASAQRMPDARPSDALCAAPLAPIRVDVTPEAEGGDVALRIDVAPRAAIEGLTWEIEAHAPAVLIGGATRGELADRGGRRRAVVAVPDDGYVEVDVRVSGLLAGTDERVTVLRTLTWGTPPVPGTRVPSLRGAGGGAVIVNALPTVVAEGPRATPSVAAAGTFVVSGLFLFEDKAWDFGGWTGEDPLAPVRRADVTVYDAGAAVVLATGQTDAEGRFAFVCSSDADALDLVVRCDAAAVYDPAFQATQVVAIDEYVHAMFATPVLDHPTTMDVDVGTTIAPKIVESNGKEGNAFNVHDAAVAVFEALPYPPVDEVIEHDWPSFTTNAFIDGTNIGTNHGYDDAVIAHEIGHVVENLYTDYKGGGGTHTFGDSDQDPDLSLSEGFATFITGLGELGRDREAVYMDASPAAQTGGALLRMRLETAAPYAGVARGIADEVAVACALHDIADDGSAVDATPGVDDDVLDEFADVDGLSGAEALWEVFATPPPPTGEHTLNDVWDQWHVVLQAAGGELLRDVLAGFEQRFSEDELEPNDVPDDAVPLAPIDGSGGWTTDLTIYRDDGVTTGAGEPDVDWFAHDLVVGSEVKFVTRYPNGANDADTQADTRLDVYSPSGALVVSDLDSGVGRNARVNDFVVTETGRWTVAVSAQTVPLRRHGRYEYRAQWIFENLVPVLGDATAFPSAVFAGGTSQLSALASDPNDGQAFDVVWAPLDGGAVDVDGVFTSPVVGAPTTLRIEGRAVDALGAESEAVLVEVLVVPDPGCSTAASVTSLGGGKSGSVGTPQLVVDGLPVVGSSDATLRATQLLPGATAQVVIGFSQVAAPFDGGTLFPSPDLLLPVTIDASGELTVPLAIPDGPGVCGQVVVAQVIVPGDPGVVGGLQTAQSNGVELVLGH